MPQVEFNLQSFETRGEAEEPYNGDRVGKTGYRPGDPIHYRLTAVNHTTYQGTSTNTSYGKAPLLNPVVIDKVPEYLETRLRDYVEDGALDVERALDDGVLQIRFVDSETNEPREDFALPTVSVETVTGLDIGGAQQFANDRHNDGWGLLSGAPPSDTATNPADEIEFTVFTYAFDDEALGRGESLEIVYEAQARKTGLPVATYAAADEEAEAKSVFAPLYGWYGNNIPIANAATSAGATSNFDMDMASLLHDAGITGDRGHEMTEAEFLSNSWSWQPGADSTVQRRNPTSSSSSSKQTTFYDSSADTQRAHEGYLRETATNDLYTAFATGPQDDNFNFAGRARVNDEAVTAPERILWTQDGMQLNRAWLYGASEMLPDTQRAASGTDPANFYEHDGSLNSYNHYWFDYTPYVDDDYTYAVQLHEEFTVRLHGANLGDYPVENGLVYTEILPLGITPYDEQGELLGIRAFRGDGTELDASAFEYDVIQTPENDRGYRAPAQSQEAGSYAKDTRDDGVPYVVRVRVTEEQPGMFNDAEAAAYDYRQYVDIRVRVFGELPPSDDGLSYWHDELTLTTIESEAYTEVYSAEYGAFDRPNLGIRNKDRYPNDGMPQGIDVTDLTWAFSVGSSVLSLEPWGMYIRGLNAQGTTTAVDGKPALVTGDQIAMRKPTLRVWSETEKDFYGEEYHESIENFSVDLYEEFTIHSTVENQQLEVLGEYNRDNPGYNRGSGDNLSDDVYVNAPQTIGGARGSWFEPTVTIALPYGVAPVLEDGRYARYYGDMQQQQNAQFTATVNDITFNSSTPAENGDVTDKFDVSVELLEDELGKRFVMHFTVNEDRAADVAYGQSLVISPRVATIDVPSFADDHDDSSYREVLTFAGTKRPVFNPVVTSRDEYQTGAAPSTTPRDLGNASSGPNSVKSSNGLSITENDRTRRDSTSVWNADTRKYSNEGALKITERLISDTRTYDRDTEIVLSEGADWTESASELVGDLLADSAGNHGAYGGTTLNLRKPSITNTTKAASFADSVEHDLAQVDAAGTFWYATEIANDVTPNDDPHEEIKTAGDVHNSRFLVTHFVTDFAQVTGEVRIKVHDDETGRDLVYDRDEFEALGYSITEVQRDLPKADEHRNRIQWIVTPPQNKRGTFGELASGDAFKMLYQVQLVDGYEDTDTSEDDVWSTDELIVDSYVSLDTYDTTLIPEGGPQSELDFITQSPTSMTYYEFAADSPEDSAEGVAELDIDADGEFTSVYAHDTALIEILKPRADVRVNTTRPRLKYSNGLTGDNYFNGSDVIEYLVTHAENTGSGLKEFVVESILPSHETNESTVSFSNHEIETSTRYVTSGAWSLPQATLDRLGQHADDNTTIEELIDQKFRTFVYISRELAEDGYEQGEDWILLNRDGTSILENEQFDLPPELRAEQRKVRVVVRALDPDHFLVPQGTRLAIDAVPDDPDDPASQGVQSVIEVDPANEGAEPYPTTVTDNAIRVGVTARSDATSTLYIYDTVQAWGNYVADKVSKLAQSETRSYLTPSRPIVNVKYNALYYRGDGEAGADDRYGWSDVTTIQPRTSPHLKFKGEFINADRTMWDSEEDNAYSEDLLMDPFVTFQLPTVIEAGGEFTYVPAEDITPDHPLHDDHRSARVLARTDSNQWTWRILHADGTEANENSELSFSRMHTGPWPGFDRNLVSIWFEGQLQPGDMVVVEFIASVDAYAPGAEAEDLKSRALLGNNTGLLSPLNSQLNASNRLGYQLDTSDFDEDRMTNDRMVLSEKTLFQYANYDDYGKRKVAYSDLNRAGTVAPESTPVRQGGTFGFEVSVDNPQEVGRSYTYPILYDVLPFQGDTSITRPSEPRNSQFSAWLEPDSISLLREGTDARTYDPSEYTVYVGPLTRQGDEIVEAEMVPAEAVAEAPFYDDLRWPGEPSEVRDAHFVELDAVKDQPDLLKQAKTLLVLLNNPSEQLPGKSKLKLNYAMKAPHNAPAYLEQFDDESRKSEASLWNSFMATQGVSGFIPQQSNNAGVFVTEQRDKAYLGNYVWNDVNYDGLQNEGTPYVDSNGRTHLRPSQDLNFDGEIDDPGINGVKVTLLSENGYHVDALGNPIVQQGDDWQVVDEHGEPQFDEVFGLPVLSEGPLVTTTETDIHGNAGYYTFSNIEPGRYRVMFEFPHEYAAFSATTQSVFDSAKVSSYRPGVPVPDDVHAAVDDSAFVAITEPALVDQYADDALRMSFDLGVAHTITMGGTIFEEQLATLDGYQGAGETGLEGYHVYLKRTNGDTAEDVEGNPLVTRSDETGHYAFTFLPLDREYRIEVTDPADEFNTDWLVSPIVHFADPFAMANDNDGVNEKGTRIVKTGTLDFDLEGLFASDFAPRDLVSVGFYEKSDVGVIGNRVWNDLNRDGVQDDDEPGIEDQELRLEQYLADGSGGWTLQPDFRETVRSNADGYYYFTEVPTTVEVEDERVEARYQVVVDRPVTGFAFAPAHASVDAGEPAERDSDFYPNGTMHEAGEVGEHLISLQGTDPDTGISYGLTDNTIDLGLVAHARSSLSGEIFIDADGDGMKDRPAAVSPVPRYAVTLEVRTGPDGTWVDARQDADGNMIEPVHATEADAVMRVVDTTSYRFERLHIIDSEELVPYEYRVRVEEIPLWQRVTELRAGEDRALDNDFEQSGRDRTLTAVSDARILGELHDDWLLPIDSVEGTPAEHVDLGLEPLDTHTTIGDAVWEDRDRDGIRDAGEPGLPGRTISLYRVVDGELILVDDTETDADGRYAFTADVADRDPASPTFNEPYVYVTGFELAPWEVLADYRAGATGQESMFRDLLQDGVPIYGNDFERPHRAAVSDELALAKADESGRARYETTRAVDDADGGVIVYETDVTIGGTVWHDDDLDGLRDDGELGIVERTLHLWEYRDGEWVQTEDLDGRGSVVSDEHGEYSFRVSPTHYVEGEPGFLTPREYRVTMDRKGYEVWSPAGVGEDPALDSDVVPAAPGFGGALHTGVTGSFSTIDVDSDSGLVDVSSPRDDRQMDLGVHAYTHVAVIGGTVWDDADEDGERDAREPGLAGQMVTLWERVAVDPDDDGAGDGEEGDTGEAAMGSAPDARDTDDAGEDDPAYEWRVVADANGDSTTRTDENGEYAFEVLPTEYDEHASGYLQPREYRTTIEVPQGYRISEGIEPAALDGQTVGSRSAQIVTLDEFGELNIAEVHDDRGLDYAFARIPLAITGATVGYALVLAVGVLLIGAGIFLSVRRRLTAEREGDAA